MAVEHLLARLLIRILSRLLTNRLPSSPESPSEDTITRRAHSRSSVALLGYQWLVCFPNESTSPFCIQHPVAKRVFLITVVDVLFEVDMCFLFRCATSEALSFQGVAILCIVEIFLYVCRSLFISVVHVVLAAVCAITCVGSIFLTSALAIFLKHPVAPLRITGVFLASFGIFHSIAIVLELR